MIKFERISSFRIDVVNSLFLIQEFLITKSRDRFQDAKNKRTKKMKTIIIKKNRAFEAFINKQSSDFELMKAKTTVLHDENLSFEIQNVLHRADFAFERERERERKRERERERERERKQRRKQEFIAAVEKKKQNVISAVDEEERERERSRERERERRDREQAASK
jgi:hypothetical protein